MGITPQDTRYSSGARVEAPSGTVVSANWTRLVRCPASDDDMSIHTSDRHLTARHGKGSRQGERQIVSPRQCVGEGQPWGHRQSPGSAFAQEASASERLANGRDTAIQRHTFARCDFRLHPSVDCF